MFILYPTHLPVMRPGHVAVYALAVTGLVVLVTMQAVGGFRSWIIAYFVANARDPIPMHRAPRLEVAVLTTIVPGKGPIEMVLATLGAMKRIRHDGVMYVWLLDEGNDPEMKRRASDSIARWRWMWPWLLPVRTIPTGRRPAGQPRACSEA